MDEALSMLPLAFQVVAGLSLAACAGLRAFLPLFVVGLSARLGADEMLLGRALGLNDSFAWISSTPALVVFGVAVVAELSADKIPAVDHLLDLMQTWVRPIAGTLVMAASLESLDPLWASAVGIVLGGSVSAGVHVAKSQIRVASTLGTGGLASPPISFVEDILALVGSLLAVFATGLAIVVIVIGLVLTFLFARRFSRRAQRFEAPTLGQG